MVREISSEIYSTSKLVFIEGIERNLRFYLNDKLENLHKLGNELMCVISSENLSDVLKELKDNPEFKVRSFNYMTSFERNSRVFLLISLSSFSHNFSLLVKVKLPSKISKEKYSRILDVVGNYYEASNLYKDRGNLKSHYSDVRVFSQYLDGLDGFDVHILTIGDMLDKVYIDTSLSKFVTADFYKNREISSLISYIGRFDYKAGIFPELCFCLNIENLLKIRIPKRTQYIRMLICELFRVSNHIYFIINISKILGCDVIYNLALLEREKVLRLIESITGSRIMPNFIRIGGVSKDITKGVINSIKKNIKSLYRNVKKIENMLLGDMLVVERLTGIGIIDKNTALEWGLTGPNLRASGIRYDLRKNSSFLLYEDLSFITPLGKCGDCMDRVLIRFKEIYQSIKMVSQITERLPPGVTQKMINLAHLDFPLSTMVSTVECPHGVFRIYTEIEKNKVLNLVIMGPSKNSLMLAEKILCKTKLDDLNLILGSLDISSGEIMS